MKQGDKTSPKAGDYLVVYGTLRKNGGAGKYMEGAEYIDKAIIPGKLYHLGGFPGLKEGEGKVVGELYEIIDPSIHKLLDMYEGYDPDREDRSLFIRRKVEVELETPDMSTTYTKEAWVYYFNGNVKSNHLIEDGDWLSND